MLKCFLCKATHNKSNYLDCNKIIDIIIENYKYKDYKINYSLLKKNKKEPKSQFLCKNCGKVLSSKENYKVHINNQVCINKEIKCKICNKIFENKRRLRYHINSNVCGKYNDLVVVPILNPNSTTINNNNFNNSINTTNKINKINTSNNLNQKIDTQNNQNIGTQNNIQINVNPEPIQLLPFRDASYKIPTKKYLEYANNPEQAIKKFVKDNHFNPSKPERMNILNTNSRSNKAQLFDFDDDFNCMWQMKDKTTISELLYDRGVNALFFAKIMLNAAGIKLDPKKETALNAKIKEYESDDKLKKKYIDMITDLTYDYRDMVISNKKKINSQNLLI